MDTHKQPLTVADTDKVARPTSSADPANTRTAEGSPEPGPLPVTAGYTPDHQTDPSAAPPEDVRALLAADLVAAFGDRYEIEGELGQRGFGAVFRALDRRLNRRVAIKATPSASPDPDRLLREAR